MLYSIMRECRNDFRIPGAIIRGNFKIEGGVISPFNCKPGQYYIIEGSVFNDGLHTSYDSLDDEEFSGALIPLAVPKAFINLADRIQAWQEKAGEPSAMQSESFGGYSYTRATAKDGGQVTWKDAFRNELAEWRKI